MKSLILAVGFIIASVPAFAQDYGQPVANPYDTPVVVQPTTNDNGIKVKDIKGAIEVPARNITNPTGQVTDQEFDGLVHGRDGR